MQRRQALVFGSFFLAGVGFSTVLACTAASESPSGANPGEETSGADAGASGEDTSPSNTDSGPGPETTADNVPPTVALNGPEDWVAADTAITLEALVADTEDAIEQLSIAWEAVADGSLLSSDPASSEGLAVLLLPGLPPGEHAFRCRVTDTQGASSVAEWVVRVNSAPGAAVVGILPEAPTTVDELKAVVLENALDMNRAPETLTYTYRWYRNGEDTGIESHTVPASETARGQAWEVRVTAQDLFGPGPVATASVTIGNALPVAPSATLEPAALHFLSAAVCTLDGPLSDPDGDTLETSVAWWVAGELSPVTEPVTTILALAGSSAMAAGTLVQCRVTVSDGQASVEVVSEERAVDDVDLCAVAEPPCGADALCSHNGTTQPDCTCLAGFEGDGLQCTDIDDCAGTPCGNAGVCQDGVDGFVCDCSGTGFEGDTCDSEIDECATQPCVHGTCVDGSASFSCDCSATGFEGELCAVNTDDCADNPCQNQGACADQVLGYVCDCDGTGFDGPHCENNINDCAAAPCQNGGQCADGVLGFVCDCSGTGYDGTVCTGDIDDCASEPCENNGQCTDQLMGFVCDCTGTGFEGVTCALNVNDCASEPCANGGACVDAVASFSCECAGTGFEGTHCENNINDCASTPCENGGECTDQVKGFVCDCSDTGYEDATCSTHINDCESAPCVHGTCVDQVGAFLCDCSGTAYEGATCADEINECASEPCLHGGNCTDLLGAFACDCQGTGYQGPTCAILSQPCASAPCPNAASCVDLQPGFLCTCPVGSTGQTCDVNTESWSEVFVGAPLNETGLVLILTWEGQETAFELQWSDTGPVGSNPPSYFIKVLGQSPENAQYSVVHRINSVLGASVVGIGSTPSLLRLHPSASFSDPDDCAGAPCNGNGTCIDAVNSFSCECDPGYGGETCLLACPQSAEGICSGHGTCDTSTGLCQCDAGYSASACDECAPGHDWIEGQCQASENCTVCPGASPADWSLVDFQVTSAGFETTYGLDDPYFANRVVVLVLLDGY